MRLTTGVLASRLCRQPKKKSAAAAGNAGGKRDGAARDGCVDLEEGFKSPEDVGGKERRPWRVLPRCISLLRRRSTDKKPPAFTI